MHNPKVYIIILNYLQWQDTRDCLESVLQSSYDNFSVLLVDNNSQNNSLEHLIEWAERAAVETISPKEILLQGKATSYRVYNREMLNSIDWQDLPRLTFIQNEINAGFAGGNNIVLRFLAGLHAYLWLLNPDMVIREDTMAELVNFAARQSSNSIIGAELRSYTGNRELLFYGGGSISFLSGTIQMIKDQETVNRLDYISGACLFTHASNFKNLGLLPEDYFLYWEETDWCYRAKQQGLSLLVCPSAICYDKISTIIGKGFLADYYYCRNGLFFISKFRKKNMPIVLFSMILRLFKRIIMGQWSRAWGVVKGTIDFLKGKSHAVK